MDINYYYRKLMPKWIRRKSQFLREPEENRKLKTQILNEIADSNNQEFEIIKKFLKHNALGVFNYPFIDEYVYRENKIFFDKTKEMFYVLVDNKRMYFKRGMTRESVNAYYNSLCVEQDERSPHSYLSKQQLEDFSTRTVLDIGAAEGNFSLMLVERAKEIVLFECDEGWCEALKATFEPYSNVKIVQKFVSDINNDTNITLDEVTKGKNDIDFVKMDIEGVELEALSGANKMLEANSQVKIAICVYHKADAENRICEFLKEYQKNIRPGYMFFLYEPREQMHAPLLRHGVIIFKKQME